MSLVVTVLNVLLFGRCRLFSVYRWKKSFPICFFATLTYNNESLPTISSNDGSFEVHYADFRDVQNMMKRLRKRNAFSRPFRYFAVSERGKKGRPHFHILFMLPKYDADDYNTCLCLEHCLFSEVLSEWSRNYGSSRRPVYRPLCTYVRKLIDGKWLSNFDLHYVNPVLSDGGSADVGFYLLKYMMKPSVKENRLQQALRLNLDPEEYNALWKVVKSRHVESESFGYGFTSSDFYKICDYLSAGVLASRQQSDFPLYYSPVDALSFPLSRFYRNNGWIMSFDDALFFVQKRGGVYLETPAFDSQSQKFLDDFRNRVAVVQSKQTDIYLEL